MVFKILRRYTLLVMLISSISFGIFKQIRTACVSWEDVMRGAPSPDLQELPNKTDDRLFILQYRAAPRLLKQND